MVTPLKTTGRAMLTVSKEILDGFCSVVVRGATMNWLPPAPPLPVTVTLLRPALPPKPLIPENGMKRGAVKSQNQSLPFRLDCTSIGIPAIGTSPMDVRTVASAEPVNPIWTSLVRVTAANSCVNAPWSRACSGILVKAIGKSTKFPVDTPPSAGAEGITSLKWLMNNAC